MSDETASPWPKARAAALLLSLEYSDELVSSIFTVLAKNKYDAERDSNFNSVNEAGEAIIRALVDHTPKVPRHHLELVLLLDDMRRERIESFGRGKWIASDAVKEIVGSEFYDAYDKWVSDYRDRHGLHVTASSFQASEDMVSVARKKPWWKVW